jgi:uncharacterized membrane protein
MLFPAVDSSIWCSNAPDIGQTHFVKGVIWLKQIMSKEHTEYWYEFKTLPGTTAHNAGLSRFYNRYTFS